jgi:hypothetical protein
MNYLSLISLSVSLLVLGCTGVQANNQADPAPVAAQTEVSSAASSPTASSPAASSPAVSVEASPTQVAQAEAEITGTFVSAEHPTEGMVRIVTENGDRYLEFDETFRSDSGPDLYVILHRVGEPPVSGIQEQDYVTLAPLQTTTGTQRYAIPADVDLEEFNSAVIWCRMFNATFGYATLVS